MQKDLPPCDHRWVVTVAGQRVGEHVEVGRDKLVDMAHGECPVR